MTRIAMALLIAIGCLGFVVAIVNAQEDPGKPGLFPFGGRTDAEGPQPTPALRASAFDAPNSDAETSNGSGAPARRPSSADRLKQLRDGTTRTNGSAFSQGRPVMGPVKSNPVDLGRKGTTTNRSNDIGPVEPAPFPARLERKADDGTTSVLKKAEENAPSDRVTARRLLRAPPRSAEPATLPRSEPSAFSPSALPASTEPAILPSATTRVEEPPTLPETTVLADPARSPAREPAPRPTKSAALLASQGPSLRVETTGPSSIVIGKEAAYVITLINEGPAPATGIYLRVGPPAGVRASAEGSSPDTGPANDMAQDQRFVWSIAHIPPRGLERVVIRVVPTENKPIALQVDYTTRPVSAQAQIEVLQPQLELAIFGPRDILYGDTAVYTIRLSNPGTGDATDVAVEFGYAEQRLEPKRMGTLAAGQQSELKVELNAREAGAMEVLAAATASGGLQVNAKQEVLVRRAKLEVEVAGDPMTFAGSPAAYRISVRNAGDAPATEVQALLKLPTGAKLLSGDGLKPTAEGLATALGTLAPGADRVLTVQCELQLAGDNQIAVRAAGASEQQASHVFVTHVEALADLKLSINDPQGPVAVNKEAVYELHIINRGSKAATKVSVVAQFSQGIEPISAAGAGAQIVPGQVLFDIIPRIDPGQELTLTVRARADSEGTKRFRAEVTSEESDTQLVAQETTYFYKDAKK